eukprot:PhM_4_TR5174/c1_g1_i1/m.27073/K17302/COPB2, SEC27; coatomer subunit beta'
MDLQDIKKKLVAKSERVKCVDLHPREPWVIASLYTGQISLWNYETSPTTPIKTFDILDLPIRAVKFIVRQSWFICGSDDMHCRVFNYNTMEKVTQFEAHQDYIRSIAVHDQLPYVLTSSDDMTIKLWDWSKNWANTKMFEGHSHYVMSVVFNPKDANTFASAALDHTVKVWNLTSTAPNFTLEHDKGVNCVEYFPGGDKPYLVSGSDDRTVKVWDYQTKACVHTLTGHTNNVSSVIFHPDLPLLLTGSEDETVNIYDLQTYRLEKTLNFNLMRVWSINAKAGSNKVAIGCDKGMVVIRIGKEDPAFSMDVNGKIIMAVNREIQRMDVRSVVGLSEGETIQDGERLMLQTKELSTMESIPAKLEHNNTGQFICVMTNGEYSINTALAWRPKCYGPAISFAWGPEGGQYVILEDSYTLKTFKNFKEKDNIRLPQGAKEVFCGSSSLFVVKFENSVTFYDWETMYIVRSIALPGEVKNVYWNESSTLVALVTDSNVYFLRYNMHEVQNHIESTGGRDNSPDGLEFAFEVVEELDERVRQGQWIGDVFLFTNKSHRVNYYVAGNVYTITVMERPAYLLGFVAKENRVYLMDKERAVISFSLPIALLEFKTAIAANNLDAAQALLSKVPKSLMGRVAKFLDHQGHKELAMHVTDDDEHKFELAIQIRNLSVAMEIARREDKTEKWKHIGDLAMRVGEFDLAAESLFAANDYNGLLLLFSCTRNLAGLKKVSEVAQSKARYNIAFTSAYMCGDVKRCVELLVESKRVPEAAIFARSHGVSAEEVTSIVQRWKVDLASVNTKLADCIADPIQFPNLFPEVLEGATTEEADANDDDDNDDFKDEEPEKVKTMDAISPVKAGSRDAPTSPSMLSPEYPKAPPATPVTQMRASEPSSPSTMLTPGNQPDMTTASPVQPPTPVPSPVTEPAPSPAVSTPVAPESEKDASPVQQQSEETSQSPDKEEEAETSSPKKEEDETSPKPQEKHADPFDDFGDDDDDFSFGGKGATTAAAEQPAATTTTSGGVNNDDDLDDIFDMKDE